MGGLDGSKGESPAAKLLLERWKLSPHAATPGAWVHDEGGVGGAVLDGRARLDGPAAIGAGRRALGPARTAGIGPVGHLGAALSMASAASRPV
jgi:hypothetical protein